MSSGQESPKAAAPASGPRFAAPEVLKLDWNTRCPRVADFNGDGRPDLAVLNLDRARIEFLVQGQAGAKLGEPEKRSNRDRWNPVLEWSRFEKQPLVVGQSLYALAVGDWNEDGKADVAYTTDEGHLVWRFQGAEPFDWSEQREFLLDSVSADADSMVAADLNADGRVDLALMTKTRLLVWRQGKQGQWPDPEVHALSDRGAVMLRAADVDGDGRVDLFATGGEGASLLLRRQGVDGRFGEEWSLEVPQPGTWLQPVRLGGKGVGLAWLQENTSMVQLAEVRADGDAVTAQQAATRRQAIPPTDARTGASVFGDLTGDGYPDVVLADPKAALVWVYAGQKDGGFASGQEYPALSGVEGLTVADIDGDQKAELVLFSPGEKVVAVAVWKEGRLSYPETVYQSAGSLLAVTAGAFREGVGIVAVEEKKPKVELLVLRGEKGKQAAWKESREELENPPSKISALRLADADQDGQPDVVLFSSLSPAQIRLSRKGEAANTSRLLKVTGLPDALMTKLPPGALTSGDVDGDAKPELIVAKEGLARALVVGADGRARVVEQFNAPTTAAKVAAALVWGTGPETTVGLLDTASQRLHELRRGSDGVFRVERSRVLGVAAFEEAHRATNGASARLICLSKDCFDVVPLTGATLELRVRTAFDSELKDTKPTDLLAAAFGGGAVDDVVTIDASQSRVLEFFRATTGEAHDWQSLLYFPVFQADPHYRGKQGYEFEPHDYAVMDINADGRLDLCLLVHDRLLLYVAEGKP